MAGPKQHAFEMLVPGACHHARFMAKAIYILKMFMLSPQLEKRKIMTKKEIKDIERMTKFIVFFYAEYFLKTSLTTQAPSNDLALWKDMLMYQVN